MRKKVLSESDVLSLIAEACNQIGNQSRWARHAGVSPQYLTDVLRGRRSPGRAICNALGLERVVSVEYRRI